MQRPEECFHDACLMAHRLGLEEERPHGVPLQRAIADAGEVLGVDRIGVERHRVGRLRDEPAPHLREHRCLQKRGDVRTGEQLAEGVGARRDLRPGVALPKRGGQQAQRADQTGVARRQRGRRNRAVAVADHERWRPAPLPQQLGKRVDLLRHGQRLVA